LCGHVPSSRYSGSFACGHGKMVLPHRRMQVDFGIAYIERWVPIWVEDSEQQCNPKPIAADHRTPELGRSKSDHQHPNGKRSEVVITPYSLAQMPT
jgi:hypothetical protein